MINPYQAAEAFVTDFRHMEYALKRSGYLRKGKEVAEADWAFFAKDLGPEFFEHVMTIEIAKNLIGHPPRRLLTTMQWSPLNPPPLNNVAQLMVNGVCRGEIGDRLSVAVSPSGTLNLSRYSFI